MIKKLDRKSNFELMRLVSMFFIVIWHVMVHGKIFDDVKEPLILISNVITGIIIVHVNSLVFLTGYFGSEKKDINWGKNIKLLGTTWFYKVGILFVFLNWNLYPIHQVEILEEILPLDINNYWFINYYLVLSFLSPYLNKVIEKLEEKDFQKFLGMLFLLFSIIPAITNGRTIMNNGYTLMNLLLMYYLGAYFNKYPILTNYHFKMLSVKQLRRLLLCVFFAVVFIRLGFLYFADRLLFVPTKEINWFGKILQNDFFRYSSPLVIIQSCCYCLWFECLNLKSKFINFCAKSTLGIYLFHDNHFLRLKIYKWLKVKSVPSTLGTLKVLLLSSITIYIVSFLVETFRRLIVEIFGWIKMVVKNRFKNVNK